MYPRGEGQHQRPFFCFGAQGTWTTPLGQSNALDDGLPLTLRTWGGRLCHFLDHILWHNLLVMIRDL
jgi:hypothetical protein